MFKICKPSFLPVFVLFCLLVLSACSTATPAPTATAQPPHTCTVQGKNTWSGVFADLGYDYYHTDPLPEVRVNGYVENPKTYTLQPDDVVSLVDGINCTGYYNQAVAVEFDEGTISSMKGEQVVIGGFRKSITAQGYIEDNTLIKGVQENLHDLCADVARSNGYQISAISNGCNYTTVVKYSLPSGTTICRVFDSVPEANDAVAISPDLGKMQSLAMAVLQVTTTEAKALCR